MQIGIYGIRDNKAQSIPSPVLYLHRHVATAIRMFSDIAADQNGNNMLNLHPEDFDLVHVADLDEDSQLVTPVPLNKQLVLTGTALRASQLAANKPELVKEA